MSLYSPFTFFKETARLLFQKRVKDGQLAFLGDTDGTGARVEVPDAPGYVYARFQNVPDANGNATFSAPFLVRSGQAAFQNYPGASVYVAVGYNGELQIVEANYQELTRNGIDTRTLNPLHQQAKWVYLWQLTIGLASAVGNSVNNSYLVTVKKYLRYFDNVFAASETGAQADKISLASVIPAVDMHRYATVWLDAYTGDFEVTTSITQSLFTTLDDSDLLETVTNRPPDAVPHKTFYLANNQGTITQQPVADRDVRQFLNMPAVHGFPNPVAYRERIHPDKQQLFAGSLVVTGSLEVLGSLIGVPTVSGSGSGSSGAPADATYITQTPSSDLTAEQALSGLATGILKSTTGTGVVSIAAEGTDYSLLPVVDTTAIVKGSADATKKVRFEVDGLTTGTTRAVTVPDADGTMMLKWRVGADTGSDADVVHNDLVEFVGDGETTDISIAAKVITIGVKSKALPKLCDLRMAVNAGSPEDVYSAFTNAAALNFLPVYGGGTFSLPVAGVWNYYDIGNIDGNIDFAKTGLTGSTTNASAIITAIQNTEQLAVGMKVAGTGINAAATIASINSTSQITMSHNASATNTGVALTFTFPDAVNYDVFLKYSSIESAVIPVYEKWSTNTARVVMPLSLYDYVVVSDNSDDLRFMGSIRATTGGFQKNSLDCFVSNHNHPYPHKMLYQDTTASWSYTTTTWRQWRGQSTAMLRVLVQLYSQMQFLASIGTSSTTNQGLGGIGFDSASTPYADSHGGYGGQTGTRTDATTHLTLSASQGFHTIYPIERGATGATFYGSVTFSVGIDVYAGLSGLVWS